MRKRDSRSIIPRLNLLEHLSIRNMLLAAGGAHLTLTLSIFLVGRFALLPGMLDTNGIGITFAADCLSYRTEAISFIGIFSHQGIIPWLAASSEVLVNPFHLKLYSLSFAVFGPWLGYNILSAEPLNVVYYLSILYLVFALGQEVFDRRVGLLAAMIVALWPSFLLHTTQLFRDPLFIAAVLALTLICSRWLTRDYSWLRGIGAGAIGAVVVWLLWLLRSEMWEVMLAIAVIGVCLLVARQVREKRFMGGNLAGAALLLIAVVSIPRMGETSELQAQPGAPLPARITQLRRSFVTSYPGAGSNVDTDVEFSSSGDIIRYLPRAAIVGFFSPFPNMWFVAGLQAGLIGRVVSGLETLMMYVIELLAVWGLWRRKGNLPAWLLLLAAGAGVTALGLVVVNVAALYRMRYAFWVLIIIVGAEGMMRLFSASGLKKRLEIKEFEAGD
jgi:hypothetical protein